ncbi:glycoside hydrolase family 97 catalytic domain-containing protein [Draconibacterium sp. IB214405]|uniref:glycoside hydrolase family 97 protein n=1 Tax=Draconibacterium sp. IB214405 TaxID=3097352 RepID=UPI002A15E4BB|nr:glycoside hydrolase family 97 catalytic domain-containing protein [Draconibacterium sp. IB214405]MDX8339630.1 glycoside hydrolase family 97 catalytic domain-containing protein [Draconibacterium sp. IB214405]
MNKIIVITLLLFIFSCSAEKKYLLQSPDQNLQLEVFNEKGNIAFDLIVQKDTILKKSPIGLTINSFDFSDNVVIKKFGKTSFDETWETVNGKNKTVRNHYNEYTFGLSKPGLDLSCNLIFRCYDDGFAYRYELGRESSDSIQINKEITTLNFSKDFSYWAYNGEHPNLGPVNRADTLIGEVRTPVVLELKDDLFMGIHEAEIVHYAPFSLNTENKSSDIKFNLEKTADQSELKTSWRTFIIGNTPGELVESDLIVNLNEPCKIDDTSWIKPGKSLWDWRVWGYKAADGFEYGLNTVSHKRFIDFASKNNIQYLLIDADWYGPEFSSDSDPTQAREGVNIEECMAYAKEKGVGVILYLNDVGAKKFGLERVLKQFAEWGAVGVKYGFMQGGWQDKVRHTRDVVELCAKYKLMVDFHDGPVPPSGDRRTYPNLVTKEFCHAQADAKRSYFPETAVTSPFINMLAGPLDYTNGWFDLNNAQSREKVFQEIPGTVSAEVAKLIVTYSGWMVLPDSPEEYLKKDGLFDCIRKMPAQFDSFKVLNGKIGEYITVARGSGEDWFVGSLTNRDSRTLELDLSFLEDGQKYKATIYSDTKDTHFLTNKESYMVNEMEVDSSLKLDVFLVPGGGCAVNIEKINDGK